MPLASILIVDDSSLVRQALRRDLATLDFELYLAESPAAAFETLRKARTSSSPTRRCPP